MNHFTKFLESYMSLRYLPVAVKRNDNMFFDTWFKIASASVLPNLKIELLLYPIYKFYRNDDIEYKINKDKYIRVIEPDYYSVTKLQEYYGKLPPFRMIEDFVNFNEVAYLNNKSLINELLHNYSDYETFIIKDINNG